MRYRVSACLGVFLYLLAGVWSDRSVLASFHQDKMEKSLTLESHLPSENQGLALPNDGRQGNRSLALENPLPTGSITPGEKSDRPLKLSVVMPRHSAVVAALSFSHVAEQPDSENGVLAIVQPSSPVTSEEALPDEYGEIAPGVYVPRSYLQPVSEETASPAISPSLPLNGIRFHGWQLPALLESSPLSRIWDYPLYPLPHPVAVTSPYGWRIHPIHGTRRFHHGIDLGVPSGTPVLASTTGWVEYAGWQDGYGYTVIVRHESGQVRTLYAHLSAIEVAVHQPVMQGDVIAQTGSTGLSTGPHLHFEIQQWDGQRDQWMAIDNTQIMDYARQLLETGQSSVFSGMEANVWPHSATSPEIRVALEEGVSSVVLGSSTPAVITTAEGLLIGSIPAGAFTLQSAQEMTLSNQAVPPLFFVVPTNGGYIRVGHQWYRGKILVAQRSTGLLVVNWVDLEDYLISVVGSEAYPNWTPAALQAQAIAARSYALAQIFRHRDDLWYEVSDTPRHQAYEGVTREYWSTHEAVVSTQGIVLVPESTFSEPNRVVGGVIEAQYASTQEITNSHHDGFGMSQWGAAYMASEGYDYSAILGQYYPDTRLISIW